ncbi:MAG: hypothetical protein HQK99_14890 [Nitrospirae bacterium]|nr:hypothetical protein [Nitrospirota bacterium]
MADSEIIYAHQITLLNAHGRFLNNLPLYLPCHNAIEPLIKRSGTVNAIARKIRSKL